MAQIGRKVLYFLGAGASYGAGATATVEGGGKVPIPTQATFWDTFIRFSKPKNRSTIESFLFRYFLGYKRPPNRLKAAPRRTRLSQIDVEEVFTFLSERMQAPATPPQLRKQATDVWSVLVSEFSPVFSRFEAAAKTRQVFRDFRKNHIRTRDAVVSFNYDTVFESCLRNVDWRYDGVEENGNGLRILKPHGSVNWTGSKTIAVQEAPDRCTIVAPTHLKFIKGASGTKAGYLDGYQQIATIWEKMEQEMRSARALVFIGYSFPLADLYFSSVLRSVLAVRDRTPSVVIVNPDAVQIQKRLQSRFAIEQVLSYFDFGTFVQTDRNQLLRQMRP